MLHAPAGDGRTSPSIQRAREAEDGSIGQRRSVLSESSDVLVPMRRPDGSEFFLRVAAEHEERVLALLA